MKLKVVIRWVESVDTDRALFGVSDQEFDGIIRALKSNPLSGRPMDGDGVVRQFVSGEYLVRYALSANFRNLVILQLRPRTDEEALWRKKARKIAGDILIYLGREGLKKWLGL